MCVCVCKCDIVTVTGLPVEDGSLTGGERASRFSRPYRLSSFSSFSALSRSALRSHPAQNRQRTAVSGLSRGHKLRTGRGHAQPCVHVEEEEEAEDNDEKETPRRHPGLRFDLRKAARLLRGAKHEGRPFGTRIFPLFSIIITVAIHTGGVVFPCLLQGVAEGGWPLQDERRRCSVACYIISDEVRWRLVVEMWHRCGGGGGGARLVGKPVFFFFSLVPARKSGALQLSRFSTLLKPRLCLSKFSFRKCLCVCVSGCAFNAEMTLAAAVRRWMRRT